MSAEPSHAQSLLESLPAHHTDSLLKAADSTRSLEKLEGMFFKLTTHDIKVRVQSLQASSLPQSCGDVCAPHCLVSGSSSYHTQGSHKRR